MDVHRQTCQNCGSRNLKNLLVRDPGESDKVFVQCHDCKELVARYIVSHDGYYHHGKGFESYIRGLTRGSGELMSGKNIKKEFETAKNKCLGIFDNVLQWLIDHNKTD